jgi:hypothetical protein
LLKCSTLRFAPDSCYRPPASNLFGLSKSLFSLVRRKIADNNNSATSIRDIRLTALCVLGPRNGVATATSAAFVVAMHRPHRRVMQINAPPIAQAFHRPAYVFQSLPLCELRRCWCESCQWFASCDVRSSWGTKGCALDSTGKRTHRNRASHTRVEMRTAQRACAWNSTLREIRVPQL